MSCLIYASNGDKCLGKCDANCYNAESPECDCICGGRNHGVGKKKAIENTQQYAQEWIELYKKKHQDAQCEVNAAEVYQLKLFDIKQIEA